MLSDEGRDRVHVRSVARRGVHGHGWRVQRDVCEGVHGALARHDVAQKFAVAVSGPVSVAFGALDDPLTGGGGVDGAANDASRMTAGQPRVLAS